MEIFSFEEEKKLSNQELIGYCKNLREFLLSTPHENLTKGSLTICEKINPTVRKTLKTFCGYEIIEDGNENIKGLNGIYAHSHQSKMDHVNFIATNPNHTILLNSAVLSLVYRLVLDINGVIYVDKFNKESKKIAKLEMIRLLLQDKPVTMFPESAWNCSPNKLHLPLYLGVVDIARKSGKPIIPVVQEYQYDESRKDGIERIKSVHVRYGNPIYVKETDDLFLKLEEFSEAIASMRWNLIEEKGTFSRKDISVFDYINYLKGIARNLNNAGIDIDVEQKGIIGSDNEFYLDHDLNAVSYDQFGNYIPPCQERKLKKIYTRK